MHLEPISADELANHRRRIKRCQGTACFQELSIGFGTTSSNRLEQILDFQRLRPTLVDPSVWTGKYRQWRHGKVPSEASIELAWERSAGTVNLRYWRDLPLWRLLAEPFDQIPSQLHDLLTCLAAPVREILFFSATADERGRWSRLELRNTDIAALRELGTLDAFVALLTLSRSAQLAHCDQQHAILTVSAFSILGKVLNAHPQLEACMDDLFACLTLSFWSFWYLGGVCQELPKERVEVHQRALRTDARALCRVSIGDLEGEPELESGARLADYFSSVLGLGNSRK